MNKQKDETKKVATALLIGLVGAGALYYLYAETHQKTPLLKKVGRTIADVGEMIEHCDLSSASQAAESIEQKLPKAGDMLNSLSQWLSTGLSLWKKISQ